MPAQPEGKKAGPAVWPEEERGSRICGRAKREYSYWTQEISFSKNILILFLKMN